MEILSTVLFGLGILFTAITLFNFVGTMIEVLVNKKDAEHGLTIIALLITTIIWSFYHYFFN